MKAKKELLKIEEKGSGEENIKRRVKNIWI